MLSHVDENNQPTMVDVSDKRVTSRTAHARALVRLPDAVRAAIHDGDIATAKGPVFQTAIIAGTMGAKKTHELIPFCHPIGLDGCRIRIETFTQSWILCGNANRATAGVAVITITRFYTHFILVVSFRDILITVQSYQS